MQFEETNKTSPHTFSVLRIMLVYEVKTSDKHSVINEGNICSCCVISDAATQRCSLEKVF